MDIRKLTDSIVKKYNSRNPFIIAKERNVILIFAPLVNVRGFYQYFQRNHIIYIDQDLPEHEKKFVCAHELGHMFLHKKSNFVFMDTRTYLNTDKYEREANRFAVELLIPDEVIMDNMNCTLEQLARLVGYEQRLIEFTFEKIYTINNI